MLPPPLSRSPPPPPWVCFFGSPLSVRPPLHLCLCPSQTRTHTLTRRERQSSRVPAPRSALVPMSPGPRMRVPRGPSSTRALPPRPAGHLRRPVTDHPSQHTGSPSPSLRSTCTLCPARGGGGHTVSRLTRARSSQSRPLPLPPAPRTGAPRRSWCGPASPMPPHAPQPDTLAQMGTHSSAASHAMSQDVTHLDTRLELLSVVFTAGGNFTRAFTVTQYVRDTHAQGLSRIVISECPAQWRAASLAVPPAVCRTSSASHS